MPDTEAPEAQEEPQRSPPPLPVRQWGRWDWVALALVTLIGGALRFVRLDLPKTIVFDETYYAKDACWYVLASTDICEVSDEQSNVHPPLAKWLIAIGIRLFDYDSFGWRVAAAVAGTATVALLYLLARRIMRSTFAAAMASGLLAFDLLHFVQSRMSMLDIFVPLFGVAAILFTVYDRDRFRPELHSPEDGEAAEPASTEEMLAIGSGNGLLDRPWRLAAGACAGAAVACKWSGLFYLVAVIVLTIVWEIAARRADGTGNAVGRVVLQETLSIVVWLLFLPVVFYVITYLGRLEGDYLASPLSGESFWRQLWDRHVYMWDFHRNLTSSHGYQSNAQTWLLIKRPVSYFFVDVDGKRSEIMATGSPFVWWASILALLYVGVRWVRNTILSLRTKGGTGSFWGAEGVILAGFLFTYGPWLLPSKRSAIFIFYLLPTIPFMCLALAYVAISIGRSWEARTAIALFTVGTIGLFAFYYPLTANVLIPQEDWDRRIWIFDNCDKPPGTPTTTTVTETLGPRRTTTTTTVTSSDADLPPLGWCWI
ncbi:MAG: phospholipid carrier-dependent glycosyltransferase [Actinomycetota bacterium]|nr:phospholipid carrier-dependent glycosyltransferase [Actinomycetota bacterium]